MTKLASVTVHPDGRWIFGECHSTKVRQPLYCCNFAVPNSTCIIFFQCYLLIYCLWAIGCQHIRVINIMLLHHITCGQKSYLQCRCHYHIKLLKFNIRHSFPIFLNWSVCYQKLYWSSFLYRPVVVPIAISKIFEYVYTTEQISQWKLQCLICTVHCTVLELVFGSFRKQNLAMAQNYNISKMKRI